MFDGTPTVGDMGSAKASDQPHDVGDTMRESVTAAAGSASALLRRMRHQGGMLVLELDVTGDLTEAPPSTPVTALRGVRRKSLRGVVEALEKAAQDDAVGGLVAHVASEIGFSQVAELRAAVGRFRASGKRTAAYAETFGEMGPGNSSYHLASAFEEICCSLPETSAWSAWRQRRSSCAAAWTSSVFELRSGIDTSTRRPPTPSSRQT